MTDTMASSLVMDNLDVRILSELAQDASVSIPVLAKRLGANSSVVYSRIGRMKKRGLIERFTVIINDRALGYQVKSLVGINMDSRLRENVIEELFKIDGIREISEVTGRFDVLVTVYSKSLAAMHETVSDRIGKIDGVVSSESFIEMKTRRKIMPYMPHEGE